MRSALLFAIRVLLPTLVLVYVLLMLASSCMPVSDTMGEAQAVPRWEYWLLHASVPSAIGWQWTGGLQPIQITDRIPIVSLAAAWLILCCGIGNPIAKLDSVSARLSKCERICIAILVGQSVLSTCVFLMGWLIGVRQVVLLLVASLLFVLVCWRWKAMRTKLDRQKEQGVASEYPSASESVEDVSFSSSIRRRMIGLLFLATAFLAGLHLLGATMPTQDVQVREVDWWLVKQAAMEGEIRWSMDHALVNAPAGLAMSSLAFTSLLTADLPLSEAIRTEADGLAIREKWNGRLRTGVLAGKTANAMLCLVGILLVSLHVGRRSGFLPGLLVGFLLVATPGIAELIRLGRTEVCIGVWCGALAVVWQTSRVTPEKRLSLGVVWGLLLAGAISSGYAAAVLVGLPAIALWLTDRWQHGRSLDGRPSRGWFMAIAVGVLLSASAFYLRNTIACGDPIYPWGGVLAQRFGIVEGNEFNDALNFANRVPSETIAEAMASVGQDAEGVEVSRNRSPYRLSNLLDGLARLLGDSNVHGLMLVPLALVAWSLRRTRGYRVVSLWFLYWIAIWWLFFTRQDRDWVGAWILLAWPAAAGSEWMLKRARGYPMMLLVSIAIAWSLVVLPVWPTSDNRILVSLDQLARAANSSSGVPADNDTAAKKFEPETNGPANHANAFRSVLERQVAGEPHIKVLLVGESDDFDFLAECTTNGPFNRGLLDKWSELPALDSHAMLRDRQIGYVLVVWTGVQYRERLTGLKRELDYRSTLSRLISESCLTPIPWEISSSQAELFRVNENKVNENKVNTKR